MSPDAIELALDSHEDELSRTAIDIGMLARRVEQLEATQAKVLDILQLLSTQLATSGGEAAKTSDVIDKMLAAIHAEEPIVESNELLTAQVRKPTPPTA